MKERGGRPLDFADLEDFACKACSFDGFGESNGVGVEHIRSARQLALDAAKSERAEAGLRRRFPHIRLVVLNVVLCLWQLWTTPEPWAGA